MKTIREKKVLLQVFLFNALFLCLLYPFSAKAENLTITTTHGIKTVFDVEIAKTAKEQERGLMFRKELAANKGMLFMYAQPTYVHMWMKNTLIPLDMLFADKSGRITKIIANARPIDETPISSGPETAYILEIPAGTAARLSLAPGDALALQP